MHISASDTHTSFVGARDGRGEYSVRELSGEVSNRMSIHHPLHNLHTHTCVTVRRSFTVIIGSSSKLLTTDNKSSTHLSSRCCGELTQLVTCHTNIAHILNSTHHYYAITSRLTADLSHMHTVHSSKIFECKRSG